MDVCEVLTSNIRITLANKILDVLTLLVDELGMLFSRVNDSDVPSLRGLATSGVHRSTSINTILLSSDIVVGLVWIQELLWFVDAANLLLFYEHFGLLFFSHLLLDGCQSLESGRIVSLCLPTAIIHRVLSAIVRAVKTSELLHSRGPDLLQLVF